MAFIESQPKVALFKATTSGEVSDDRYAHVLSEHNYCGIVIPTLAFESELDELRKRLLQPENYAGVILTSPRSVECVQTAMENCMLDVWQNKRYYCVGEATRIAASQVFPIADIICSENGNAQHLSSMILEDYFKRAMELPLLFPCSSMRMDTIPNALTENKIHFEAIESYRTVPYPQLDESIKELAKQNPVFLVFFSPSGVQYTMPSLTKYGLSGKKVISIGKTTAKALADVGIDVSHVCSKPTPESLVEALNLIQ